MKNLLLSFFLVAALCSRAATIYVVPNGIDNWSTPGSGSSSLPYNLQYGLWAAGSGDTVLLAGTFSRTEQIYLENTNLTIGSWGSGATIQGSSDPATDGFNLMVLKNATNVTVQDITFSQNFGNGSRGIYVWGKGDNVTIKNCVFTNIGWSVSDTAIAPGGYGAHAVLVLGNKNDASYTNINITGNAVTNCITGWSESITIIGNVDGFLIADNYLADITNIGIDVAGHFSWVLDWDTNDPLADSLNQARNGRIRNNTVTNAISPIATAAGIYCDGCRDVIIERNIVTACGAGISIGCEVGGGNTASHVTVMNNIFRDNKESGMFLGSSTSEESELGPSSVDSCVVKNNTFYKNGAANTSNDYEVFLQNSRFNKFYNNILYIGNDARGIVSASGKEVDNFIMDYNLFYRANESTADLVISGGSMLSGNAHSQFGDPGFSGELDITTTSRAANAGDPATSILSGELDRDGGARKYASTIADIGAQESSSTQTALTPNFYLTNAIGETASLTVSQAGAGQWHTVYLTNYYNSPVVIMSPLSYGDSSPATLRVKNVTSYSFDYQIDEWDYLDGAHSSETFFYMVVEEGMYELDGGVTLQAGNSQITNSWSSVDFPEDFDTVPLVFAQAISFNDTTAIATRIRYIDSAAFELKVQEEEANAASHAAETVSWVALTEGSGNAGRSFEVDGTDADYDHIFYEIYFNNTYDVPMLFAHMQTTNDNNPAALRYRFLLGDEVEIKVQEEKSNDTEVSHGNEEVGFMVFDSAGSIYGIRVEPGSSSRKIAQIAQVEDVKSFSYSLYPNPVSDKLSISYNLQSDAAVDVSVFGLDGVRYYHLNELQSRGNQTLRISVLDLPKGILMVQFNSEGKTFTQRVIVK